MKRVIASVGIALSVICMFLSPMKTNAETKFYPIDGDLFKALYPNLSSLSGYNILKTMIIYPSGKVALSTDRLNTSTVSYLNPYGVSINDDNEEIVFSNDYPSDIISLITNHGEEADGYTFPIFISTFEVAYSSSKASFVKEGYIGTTTSDYYIVFDSNTNLCQIKTGKLSNKVFYINYGPRSSSSSENGFILSTDPDTNGLSLYIRDNFDIQLSEPNDEGQVTVSYKMPINNKGDAINKGFRIHYIINDGTPVSYDELLASEQFEELVLDKTNPIGSFNITVADKGSKLWVAPVAKTSASFAPFIVGRMEMLDLPYTAGGNKEDESEGEGGITTGIDSMNNASVQAKTYYNIQGVRIPQPTLPGCYIVKEGNTVKKIRL